MRVRSVIIVGISVAIVATMILCFYLILPLFLPIPVPAEVLRDKAKEEKAKAEREDKERQAAYRKHQDRLKMLFEQKRDGTEICQVHKDNLEADRVRIAYGLIILPQEYLEAEERQFPNSNKVAYGGCVWREDSPEFAYVFFCTQCRDEETRWEAQHHIGPVTQVPNKEKFVSIGEDEASGHLLSKIDVIYPQLAEQARITGVVRVNLFISPTGRVIYVELVKGHPLLSQAAIDVARTLVYRPFVRGGKRVQAITELAIPFALPNASTLSDVRP